MNKLLVWDWKFKIFFNTALENEVDCFIHKLESDEKRIYMEMKQFYMSFYSMATLLDAISEHPEKTNEYLEKAEMKKEQLIKTPKLLQGLFEEKVQALQVCEEEKSRLGELLAFSLMTGYSKNYIELCELLYGELYSLMNAEVLSSNGIRKVDHGEKIEVVEVSSLCREYYQKLNGNAELAEKFGHCAIENYREEIAYGTGFAEWWDRDLIEEDNDLLILYANDDSLNENDLYYTIIHEMYPGHGQFYNVVAHGDKLVDHGAMSIVEGWATYAEWNTVKSEYISSIRNNALYFLKESLERDVNVKAEQIVERKQKQGYSKAEAFRTVEYVTQYIGFIEAYYYGALWIEFYLQNNELTPKEFLEYLSKKNIGDFFATWKIK